MWIHPGQVELERLVEGGVENNKARIKELLILADENTGNIPGLSYGVYDFKYQP